MLHISEQPITIANWHQHISWINVTFVIGIQLIGFYFALSTPLLWKTAIWGLFYYFLTGLGITAGTSNISSHSYRTNTNHRLPQTLVPYFIFCLSPNPNLPRSRWRRRNPRLDPLVVKEPPRTPSLCRHAQGSLFSSARSPTLTHRLVDIQAEPIAHRARGYCGLE